MKSATAYKAAVYTEKSLDSDFWKGRAVDKQINSSETSISNYWIREFLESDFLTPTLLAQEYFGAIEAPGKAMVLLRAAVT